VANDDLNIHVRLTGARAAGAEAKGLRAEIVGVGKATGGAASASGRWNRASAETEKRGRSQGRVFKGLGSTVGGLGKSYLGAAKGILAAGAAFASYEGVKSAISTTTELGKTTIGLSKNLGLSTQAASEWAAVAKTRGVDAKALNMSFGTLSKNIDASSKAGSSQAKTFEQLGVPLSVLKRGNFQEVLGSVSDQLNKMGPGAERTALSMRLFGRGWQTIVPVLRDGSKGMQEQLDLAKKYGATFGGKTIKSVGDLVKAQREAKFATLGLQIAIGTTLTPILTKVIGKFSQFVLQMRQGKGAGGELRHTLENIWRSAKPVVVWFGRAAMNLGKFAGNHPGLVKVATALLLTSKALRLMKFGGAISGAIKLYRQLKGIEEAGFGAKIVRSIAGKTGLGGLAAAAGPKISAFGGWLKGQMGAIGRVAGGVLLTFLDKQLADWASSHGFAGGKLQHFLFPLSPDQQNPIKTGLPHGFHQVPHGGLVFPGPHGNIHGAPNSATPRSPRNPFGPLGGRGTHKIAVGGATGTTGATTTSVPAAYSDPTVIHSVLQVDGKTIWEAWDTHNRNKRARR
jgi:hypothetical protein